MGTQAVCAIVNGADENVWELELGCECPLGGASHADNVTHLAVALDLRPCLKPRPRRLEVGTPHIVGDTGRVNARPHLARLTLGHDNLVLVLRKHGSKLALHPHSKVDPVLVIPCRRSKVDAPMLTLSRIEESHLALAPVSDGFGESKDKVIWHDDASYRHLEGLQSARASNGTDCPGIEGLEGVDDGMKVDLVRGRISGTPILVHVSALMAIDEDDLLLGIEKGDVEDRAKGSLEGEAVDSCHRHS
mmetsp:Transcript_40843/g.102185  ORF Transcript_40843/g.102185 Transcript_40843/m.102185 type:complete len:247 (-) Transcript_40843:122-862(-)